MADRQVWVCIPTAQKKHVPGILEKWDKAGYQIALWVDPGPTIDNLTCGLLMMGGYPGVWRAWNALAKACFAVGADVVVLAGDDMEPDPNKNAQEIAAEYFGRFPKGDGVMQPCGDPQGMDFDSNRPELKEKIPAAARICGSPWIGKSWGLLHNDGEGPVNGNYYAFYADEELKLVAEKMGLLWMRPDLSQFHLHWSWQHLPRRTYHERNQKRWAEDKAIFEARKKAGFP
jgi:hypothetical protein